MFEKLRRGFIRMNMLVISLLMLAAFVIVYTLTYSTSQRELDVGLNTLLTLPNNNALPWPEAGISTLQPNPTELPAGLDPDMSIPKAGFAVRVTNGSYAPIGSNPFFNMEAIDVPAMLEQVRVEDGYTGHFTQGEDTWTYRVSMDGDSNTYRIAFIETSESRAYRVNLVIVSAIVFICMLAVIWFVSRWFAK